MYSSALLAQLDTVVILGYHVYRRIKMLDAGLFFFFIIISLNLFKSTEDSQDNRAFMTNGYY
jgi:hypothetical protein